MKTNITTPIAAVIAVLTAGALITGSANAETTDGANGLIYNNRAYIHSIQGAPNPAGDTNVQNAHIIYVDKAYGPAIYGYPGNVAYLRADFNVQYVDTAYGPAIYSYPKNNVQHRLELVNNEIRLGPKNFLPAAAKSSNVRINTDALRY